MDIDYKNKYLKYKMKYNILKNQIGSADENEIKGVNKKLSCLFNTVLKPEEIKKILGKIEKEDDIVTPILKMKVGINSDNFNNDDKLVIQRNYNQENIHSFKYRLKLIMGVIKKILNIDDKEIISKLEKQLEEQYYDKIKSSKLINVDFLYALQNIYDSLDCQCKSIHYFIKKEKKHEYLSKCLPESFIK
jgi:hypothetical protein